MFSGGFRIFQDVSGSAVWPCVKVVPRPPCVSYAENREWNTQGGGRMTLPPRAAGAVELVAAPRLQLQPPRELDQRRRVEAAARGPADPDVLRQPPVHLLDQLLLRLRQPRAVLPLKRKLHRVGPNCGPTLGL